MGHVRRNSTVVAAVTLAAVLAGGVAAAAIGGSGTTSAEDTTTTLDTSTTAPGDTSTSLDTSTTDPAAGEPTTTGPTGTSEPTTTTAAPTTTTTAVDDRGPDPNGPAKFGLCRAFAGRSAAPGSSQAYERLREAAGGDIAGFCAGVLAAGHGGPADHVEHPDVGSSTVATATSVPVGHGASGQDHGRSGQPHGNGAANGKAGGH